MTHSWLSGLTMAGALLFAAPVAQNHILCKGFLPENNLRIPVSTHQVGGLTKEEFDMVLDQVQAFYAPVIAAHGGQFEINRDWKSATVNASANEYGSSWIINMYGGLARHPVMTKDGFTMVACHETGHHLGGAPKIYSGFGGGDWASNEGEADYFSSLRCMRNIFTDEDNAKFVLENQIDDTAKAKCQQLFSTQPEQNLCMRESVAGLIGARLFQVLRQEKTVPAFNTPDPSKVDQTDDDHPGTQCRLDTYYAGATCVHDRNVELSNTDANIGTCTLANGQHDGVRPACWFAP